MPRVLMIMSGSLNAGKRKRPKKDSDSEKAIPRIKIGNAALSFFMRGRTIQRIMQLARNGIMEKHTAKRMFESAGGGFFVFIRRYIWGTPASIAHQRIHQTVVGDG